MELLKYADVVWFNTILVVFEEYTDNIEDISDKLLLEIVENLPSKSVTNLEVL